MKFVASNAIACCYCSIRKLFKSPRVPSTANLLNTIDARSFLYFNPAVERTLLQTLASPREPRRSKRSSATISPGNNQTDSLRRRTRRPSSRKIHRSVSVDKRIEARVPLMRVDDFVTSRSGPPLLCLPRNNEISCAQGETAAERDR